MSKVKAAYRHLQQAISQELRCKSSSQWHSYVRKQFRRPLQEETTAAFEQRIQLAEDCSDMLRSIKDHKVILVLLFERILYSDFRAQPTLVWA